ncbi:MAG TPA: hypothetical protein VIG67_01650 [Yaniella sp.]
MAISSWSRGTDITDAEFDELCAELAATMDDHDRAQSTSGRFRHLRFPNTGRIPARTAISTKLQRLRQRPASIGSATAAPPPDAVRSCSDCTSPHRDNFAPQRFDSVEHSLSAIRDIACYLQKSPQTIWLALENIFTARQSTSTPNLVRHRFSILARLIPTALSLLAIALVLLHHLLPEHTTNTGYNPRLSEVGFVLVLIALSSCTFALMAMTMLVLNTSLQERFINGFVRLVTWSIPIVLSFFMISPEFLLLVQELAGGSSQNVAGITDILEAHTTIIEIIYWTALVYVGLYTGAFLVHIAFAKVFQEQRDYVHRHDVLRDCIPILVAERLSGDFE